MRIIGCFLERDTWKMNKISIRNLSFAYAGSDNLILNGIDAEVEAGEFVCILGKSGCGKSTLLRLLAGLEMPTGGELLIDGETVKGASLDRGVVFQDYGLFPWMTIGKNLGIALKRRYPDMSAAERKEKSLEMLREVGLKDDVYGKFPKELSGGMQQRSAIAQVFGMDPSILLMDEPFGALDAVTRARLQDLIIKLWERDTPKKTVFFVTHDVDEAMLLANRILVLGQSPSKIIYECRIPDDERATRDNQFENPHFLQMRGTLIRHINRDVYEHIDE